MAIDTVDMTMQEIYKQYLEIICPFIVLLEAEDNEFPIEIMNEIRAIFTHIARCEMSSDETVKENNVEKARNHLKRAILDCFKYSCLTYNNKRKQLRDDYRKADLHLIDNGTFLTELTEKEHEATEALLNAKRSEIGGDIPMDTLFGLYEIAYQKSEEAYRFLYDAKGKLDYAQSMTDKNKILAIAGLVVGILGILFGIIF